MTRRSGYMLHDGRLEPDLCAYLASVVREEYARGYFGPDELDQRAAAAVRGDHAGVGMQFMPMRFEVRR